MSQSKSLIIPFIILAVLIFGGALAWKTLSDKPEPAIVKPQAAVVKKAPAKVVKPVEKIKEEREIIVLTDEEREANQKEASRLMKLAMRYHSPEALMKAIDRYQSEGNQEKVDELIAFMIRRYPDYKLPESFGK